jgi:hypothetical protein
MCVILGKRRGNFLTKTKEIKEERKKERKKERNEKKNGERMMNTRI